MKIKSDDDEEDLDYDPSFGQMTIGSLYSINSEKRRIKKNKIGFDPNRKPSDYNKKEKVNRKSRKENKLSKE